VDLERPQQPAKLSIAVIVEPARVRAGVKYGHDDLAAVRAACAGQLGRERVAKLEPTRPARIGLGAARRRATRS